MTDDVLRGLTIPGGLAARATFRAAKGIGKAISKVRVPKRGTRYGTTPKGRPLTKHYATETGPTRNIPGSVVDNTIDTTKGVPVKGRKTVHYDPKKTMLQL